MITWPAKAPGETEDYLFDFTDTLEASETIVSRIVSVAGVTRVSDAIVAVGSEAASGVLVWLSGGTLGSPATVACTVTTSGGRTYSATAVLLIGEEPVNVEEAKAQVRYFETDRDAEIASCIADAREMVEERSGCILVQRQFVERHPPQWKSIRLNQKPVVGEVAVTYTDGSGVSATYAGARSYEDGTVEPALGDCWPITYPREQFTVTYTAGYAVVDLPKVLKRAVLLAIPPLFQSRPMTADEERAFNVLCDYKRTVAV